jgi:hypothetical protein
MWSMVWPVFARWSVRVVMLGCSMGEVMRWGSPKEPVDREVVGFGAAAGEEDAIGWSGAKEFGDAVAGIL